MRIAPKNAWKKALLVGSMSATASSRPMPRQPDRARLRPRRPQPRVGDGFERLVAFDQRDVLAIGMALEVPTKRVDDRRGVFRAFRRPAPERSARTRATGSAPVAGSACAIASSRSRGVRAAVASCSGKRTPKARSMRSTSSTRDKLSSPRSRSIQSSRCTGRSGAAGRSSRSMAPAICNSGRRWHSAPPARSAHDRRTRHSIMSSPRLAKTRGRLVNPNRGFCPG